MDSIRAYSNNPSTCVHQTAQIPGKNNGRTATTLSQLSYVYQSTLLLPCHDADDAVYPRDQGHWGFMVELSWQRCCAEILGLATNSQLMGWLISGRTICWRFMLKLD